MLYANAREITINREKVERNSHKPYLCIYEDSIIEACQNLNPSTFKVWLYLVSNKNCYRLEYSSAHISRTMNCSIETARKAFLELKEKGYIIPVNGKKTVFNFYERTQEETMRADYRENLQKNGWNEEKIDKLTNSWIIGLSDIQERHEAPIVKVRENTKPRKKYDWWDDSLDDYLFDD